ncbi:unnamed protein product (macronuclear) [Paramecium tetraurelia]|uniref:Uncharacterized protein n=1 Tax=Paramecium tetraurelia TaxID=5888 RepID=A0CZZ0_PARTE|nr:uncharacterized protein GSPATT00011931001 [Paramecium tetraurelia]CAK76357.1 unnamed protein product [Paramecium tetraurelia]|eukprot:XP_001443754.1 hypothetical protein (macronuclear) [Paramecium tetraurelia strain d4-2]
MMSINDKELEYIFQLYSSDNYQINWDDFYQLICPQDTSLDTQMHKNVNQQIVSDLLLLFQRLLKIEIAFFRQAEPIRMVLFEKHKETGKQFCTLVQDYSHQLPNFNLINFMKKQEYIFSNQDIQFLKKRIKCNDVIISSQQFIKYCPLIPFSVLINKQPEYKLIETKVQMIPEIFKQEDLFVPQIPQVYIDHPQQKEYEHFTNDQEQIPLVEPVDQGGISNYEFFTGRRPQVGGQKFDYNRYSSPDPKESEQQIDQDQRLHSGQSQNYLSPYQTILQGQKFNSPQPIANYQDTTQLDKYLRPSASRKQEFSRVPFTPQTNQNEIGIKKQEQYVQNQNQEVQQVKTMHLADVPYDPEEDLLQQYLQPATKLDQTIDKIGTSQTRKYKIFDEQPETQQQFNKTLQKSKQNSPQIHQGPAFQSQQMEQPKKSKKYVSPSFSQGQQ